MSEPATESATESTTSAKSASLADAGIKYLCGEITGASCRTIIEWILEENLKGKQERLKLFVSSYGGDVYPSFALIDTILGSKIPVDTIGLGYIASAGLMIFIHGVNRAITRNTYIVAHQWSGGKYGKQHELIAGRKEEDWLAERFIDMFVARSKLDRQRVKDVLLRESDTFLTAQEALDYGLADEIRLS